jgi:transposase-like protein
VKSKFTPELAEKIVTYARSGAYIETAVAAAGVSKSTFYEWLRKAEKLKRGPIYEFTCRLEEVLAQDELRGATAIERIAMAMTTKSVACTRCKHEFSVPIPAPPTNVQLNALQWKMERKYGERYGGRLHVDTTMQVRGALESTLEACRPHMKPESYADFVRALATVQAIAGVDSKTASRG